MYATRVPRRMPMRARLRVTSDRSVTTCVARSCSLGNDRTSPLSRCRLNPTSYWPSSARLSSCHDVSSPTRRCVVETGSPVMWAISVTVWESPVANVDRIAVILLTKERGGGPGRFGTGRLFAIAGRESGAVHVGRSLVNVLRGMLVRAEVVLQFLETPSAGLGRELLHEEDRPDVDEGEEPERRSRTQRVHQRWEDEGDRRVDRPEDEHRDAHGEAANRHREDLRQQQPHQRADERLNEEDDDQHRGQDQITAEARLRQHEGQGEYRVSGSDPGEAGEEQRPAVVVPEQDDSEDGPDDRHDTDGDGQDERRARPETGRLQDRRRVVIDGVDASGLLDGGEPAADPQDPPHPREGPQVAQGGALVLGDVALGVLGDDVVFLGRLRRVPAELEDPLGLAEPAADGVPPR